MTESVATPNSFRSGYVAIAGVPNAGKSTLLNRLLGQKISITSSKPQTTRNRILGVCHRPGAQIVFLDTPGIFATRDKLNLKIVDNALAALGDADVILAVADSADADPEAEAYLVRQIQSLARPVVLALNKVDLIQDKKALLKLIARWSGLHEFEAVVPVSAHEGTQLEDLVAALTRALPEGPPFFPEDTLTDLPERFIAAELIREKVFRFTGQEIPYATAVTVESFKTSEDAKRVDIQATIHVERDSQKGIIIGRGASMLKKIGTEARIEIEQMIGAKTSLKLFVRVEKNWRKNAGAIERFGY
ncbi:MAG: GTPase Era [Hyphomicrobiales bacterium]